MSTLKLSRTFLSFWSLIFTSLTHLPIKYKSPWVVVVQWLSHVQLFATKDCSMPGFPVLHCLPEFAQIHFHWVGDVHPTISCSVALFSSCPQSFSASGSFPVNWLFPSGGQSIGASTSATVLAMSIQGWFPLGLTGWSISQFRIDWLIDLLAA